MTFISDDFLLSNSTARQLYHDVAANQPIIDYHSHLPPDVIARNENFSTLFDVWLAGDHYKWRAMRAAGICEELCTGNASARDKFLAYAQTVPQTLRNPLYHWTHLELKRYFGIDQLLNPKTAPQIWDQCNQQLQTNDFRPQAILSRFQVKALCTTDDPAEPLTHHQQLAKQNDLPFRVYPTFRPDNAFAIDNGKHWNAWCDRLAAITNVEINSLAQLLTALKQRHDDFHQLGCRLSDHGLSYCFDVQCTQSQAQAIFEKTRICQGDSNLITPDEKDQFGGYLMRQMGLWDFEKQWTKQLHLGARRNNNTRLFNRVGADIGCDSIGDWKQVDRLANYLDDLDQLGHLPKVIVYNLNPADNYAIATSIGNFQDGTVPGKLQLGSGWWFLDQKEAMQWQMNALSNLGLFSKFIGMLTDSRSFLSFPRHEYFRRVLCDLVGKDVESGELPDDPDLLEPLIRGICFQNAATQLGLGLPN